VKPVQRPANIRAGVPILVCLALLCPSAGNAADGYRIYESTAAAVNGEVLFLSDIAREACFYRCAAFPGSQEEILSAVETRDRLILDTLALQEQKKLLLGTVDNSVWDGYARGADSRMAVCASSCRREITREQTREWIRRKLLIRDFFNRRVAVFVEVKDDEVRKELERRSAAPGTGAKPTEEQVRDEMLDERIRQEIRNWQNRAASKSRLILSPLEDR
jgi:hypothetical protein